MPAEYKKRPVYSPSYQIEKGQFTAGKELMFFDTYQEYVGLYHTYPNGATYSGAEWTSRSIPLVPFTIANAKTDLLSEKGEKIGVSDSLNNTQYFQLTEARFNKHYPPPYYYPIPTVENYDVGFINRFFAQKINDRSNITEINPTEYDKRNPDNKPGIDEGLYKFLKIEWSITGPVDDVRKANIKVLEYNEQFMPGIKSYLSDPDEFHKNRHKLREDEYPDIENNLYTEGGKYQTKNGKEYKGPYHVHPDKGPMVGPVHMSEPHEYLEPLKVKQSNQSSY